MASRVRRGWFLAVFPLGLGIGLWYQSSSHEHTPSPQIATVKYDDVQNTVAVFGTIRPNRSVEVGAQVSGQLERIHVVEGSRVEKGELVAEIDATVQRNRVEERRARLHAQEAQLVAYRSKLALAKSSAGRQTRLLAQDATSQASFESAQDHVVSWESSLVRLQSEIEQSRASLASEEAELGYSRIYAPIGGTVIDLRMTEGQTLIATQQTPVIMVIADLDTMIVEVSVPEADVSKIEPGMETYLLTVGGGVRQWEAVLGRILPNPRVEDNVVRYTTLFRVDNSDGMLLPKMTAQVFIITSSARNVLTVPYGALIPFDGEAPEVGGESSDRAAGRQAQVRTVSDEGEVTLRDIRVGVSNRVSAEVLTGLKEGERVVVGGH